MILNKKLLTICFSVLLTAFSFGFSQSVVKAVDPVPLGWKYINNTWYYLDSAGNKVTNKWQQDRSMKWFYLSSTGAMATDKWQQDRSTRWFYLGTDGAMVSNKWKQDSSKRWFYLGTDGGMVVNTWQTDSSKRKFYLGSDGAMTVNAVVQDSSGKRYFCGTDGAMAVNTLVQDSLGKKYFANTDGTLKTSSWVSYSGKWYYVNSDGTMAINTLTPDGYRVDGTGVWDGRPSASSDTQAPVITLKGSSTVSMAGGTAYSDPGVTVTDNVNTGLTATSTITDTSGRYYPRLDLNTAGTYLITYNAVDSSGNKAIPVVRTIIITSTVIVVDNTAPVITLKGYSTATVKNGVIYVDAGATATDNVDSTVNVSVVIASSSGAILSKIDTTQAGVYKITYNAKDTAGNNAIPVVRTVTVKVPGAPISFAIDIGHNAPYDSGAVGIKNENDLTMEVGNLVKSKLKALGYDVINTAPVNPTSVRDSLEQRVAAADSAGADYFASIHFNMGGGQGTEVYHHSTSPVGKIMAGNVLKEIAALGYTNRGVKTAEFYVIKYTDMPSILIEGAFLDSSTDMNLYNADAMATAIVKGLTVKP